MRKQFLACLLLCLAVVVTVQPGFAQEKGRSTDPITQMQRDGWRIVQDGVLQRDLGAGKVETFVFGARGFTWKLQDLQSQLRNLRTALQLDPTPELRKAIASHRIEIANTQKLIALAQAADASAIEPPPGKVTCSINFGYSATAAAQTSVQGVTGTASANFTGTCGFTGEVYAYSYSTASVAGAPTTQTVTDGPRSGASVTASAFTSQAGVPSCTSYAYASMTSSSLNPSSYTISATNTSCPVVSTPLTARITGTNYVYVSSGCVTSTWSSSTTSGGTTPYTYQWTWNGAAVGTGSTYSRSTCAGGVYNYTTNTLGLTVNDSASHTNSTSLSVAVEKDPVGSGCFAASDGAVICP
jgi:hypothetical protein